jgi:hypothetical protein
MLFVIDQLQKCPWWFGEEEPVWLCGCGCVFFKTQLQPFGYQKIWYTVHWVPPVFCVGNAVFTKQELHVFFALFNEQCN